MYPFFLSSPFISGEIPFWSRQVHVARGRAASHHNRVLIRAPATRRDVLIADEFSCNRFAAVDDVCSTILNEAFGRPANLSVLYPRLSNDPYTRMGL